MLSIWCITSVEMFSPLLRTVFELVNFDTFLVLLPFFLSPLPHWQNVSLWGLFLIPGNKKNVSGGEIRWREGVTGIMPFLVKNYWTPQWGTDKCTHKSPIMKWANRLKEASKKIHWSRTQPLTSAATLIQMGSQNTHLMEEACATRGPPSSR